MTRHTPNCAEKPPQSSELRKFGLLMGAVLGAIGLWPMVIRGESPRWWFIVLAFVLSLGSLLTPLALLPIYKYWLRIGAVLGWINTRIILGFGFFAMFTPVGWILRFLGKDPMRRTFNPSASTYRVNRCPRPNSHMLKPF